MITVHHLDDSRSQRILWALEELGLDYEITLYKRNPKTMLAPESLKAVHPLGRAPVITHEGVAVAESGAILEYLADVGGGLRPEAGTDAARSCTYWLHYAEGSLMPLLLLRLVFDQLHSKKVPFFVRPIGKAVAGGVTKQFIGPRTRQHLGYIDAYLADHTWFAGDAPSIADVQMSFPLQAARTRLGLDAHPHIAAWLDRVEGREAWSRGLERGGAYAYA